MENLKKTPLYEEHKKLGARIVPFAGWEMPVQYTSIIEEHNTVRNKVGLFDVSHMGQVFLGGKDSVKLLQELVPQDISKLVVGKAVYTQLTDEHAGIIDDLIIYRLEDKDSYPYFLLIVNASRIDEDFKWIGSKAKDFNVSIDNQSDNLAMMAVQGPYSKDLINDMGLPYYEQPARFSIKKANLNSYSVFIARTGYTGEDGFEIIIENGRAADLWSKLLGKGEKYGIRPIGLGARDTLRLEAAMPLYGQDITEDTTPVEASLGWSVPKNKQENYFGKDLILSQFNGNKPKKVLVGFKMLDKSIPRHDYEIYKDGKKVGTVTSGGISPTLGANIGLGYVNTSVSTSIGTNVDIMIRDKLHPAEIVKRPFYKKG